MKTSNEKKQQCSMELPCEGRTVTKWGAILDGKLYFKLNFRKLELLAGKTLERVWIAGPPQSLSR